MVVLEVSLLGFFDGAPQFADVVGYMKTRGFVAYDVLPGWTRPLDHALGQVDIVFVQDDGIFRRSQAFADPQQLESLRMRASH